MSAKKTRRHPLSLVAYHGLGGTPETFRLRSQLDTVATHLACPLDFARSHQRIWRWFAPSGSAGLERDLTTFDEVNGTVAIGFSAGADMAMRIACERTPAAIVVYAGELSATVRMPWSRPRCPALFLGSPDDRLVPPDNGQAQLAQWWGSNGHFIELPLGGHRWLQAANPHIEWFLRSRLGL